MKNSIDWHKNCFSNMKKSLQIEEEALVRMVANIERTRSALCFYETQIKAAIDKNKDGFDNSKFLYKISRVIPSK